jgi:hypothetical protein
MVSRSFPATKQGSQQQKYDILPVAANTCDRQNTLIFERNIIAVQEKADCGLILNFVIGRKAKNTEERGTRPR